MGNSIKLIFGTSSGKIILIGFLAAIVLIPGGSFLLSQRIKAAKPANKPYVQTVTNDASGSGALDKSLLDQEVVDDTTIAPSPSPSELPTAGSQLINGPSLSFKISLGGRPANNQAVKLFVGIAEGDLITNPTYILTFSVDIPVSGIFSGLSLAGLTQGQKYTAYLKGPAQIATSSAFFVTPSQSQLNAGSTLNLITGDLNEDNVINVTDYSIAKTAYGATPSAQLWNSNIDFNLDNIINNFDISILTRNLGLTGAGGPWYSRISTASSSGALQVPTASESASPQGDPLVVPGDGGHWLWVPQI